MKSYVVIDGGGTSTKILSNCGQRTLGPGNYRRIGSAGIKEIIKSVVELVRGDTKNTWVRAGFAGTGTEDSNAVVRNLFLEAGFKAERIEICTDAELLLESLDGSAIILIAGTGSICIGRKVDGATEIYARTGGYGYFLPSDFSAFGIGLNALKRCIEMEDGRCKVEGALLDKIKQEWKITSISRVVADILYPELERAVATEKVAALAPLVLACAKDKDLVSSKIIGQAIDDMAQHIEAVAARLELQEVSLGLHGGLFKDKNAHLILEPIKECMPVVVRKLRMLTVGVFEGDIDPLREHLRLLELVAGDG